ncbi:MAG: O-antigen ligase family protein [Gammaproteobacteria bacterium]|nr:O-antigen ligase family protein [Gammaproteobacteria bacterium]
MKKVAFIGVVLLGLLFFVMPLPRTISLRDLLLVLVLGCFAYLAWRRGVKIGAALHGISVPIGILVALTLWMYVLAFFISHETSWSLNEIHSQWWRGLISFAAGVLIATAARPGDELGKQALLAVFIALLAHVIYIDAMVLYQWPQTWMHGGEFNRISGFAGGADKSNYVTNVLFCFVFADLLSRRLYAKNFLALDARALWATLALTLLSMFAERMRNGVIVFVLLLALAVLLYLQSRRGSIKKITLAASAAALLVVTLGGFTLAAFIKPVPSTVSFSTVIDTVAIAWDTEKYKSWQDEKKYAMPKLPNGEPVDPSLYQRVAWFKQGLLLIKDNPLGIGFGRNAYGHGLQAKYGAGRGHSHSGILDFAIGTGVPGMLLWLMFFVSLSVLAYRRYRATHSAAALLLMFLLLDFGARMFGDSVIRDHMLQQFMLLVGVSCVLMTAKTALPKKSSA